jgi:hypothetical protein
MLGARARNRYRERSRDREVGLRLEKKCRRKLAGSARQCDFRLLDCYSISAIAAHLLNPVLDGFLKVTSQNVVTAR